MLSSSPGLTSAASSHLSAEKALALASFSQLAAEYREDFNTRMRQKLSLALTGIILFLTTMVVGIFHLGWFASLFAFMETHSEIEDPLVFLTGCLLVGVVAVMMVYIQEAHQLQRDITRLMAEKEKLITSSQQRHHLESLGTIASGISHEINTALQSILGGCELARNRIDDRAGCLQAIERTITSSLHARRIIDNVLTFSSIGGRSQSETASLTSLMNETATFCQTFLPPNMEIRLELPTEDFPLRVNRTGFMQAINNLITNSAHASGYQGHILLHASSRLIAAEKAAAMGVKPGIYANVSIIDHGKGIPPEHLSKIFDPFYTTKKEGEGTGLGLSMVHGLVRGMNGFIDIASEVGKGTSVDIFLPKTGY